MLRVIKGMPLILHPIRRIQATRDRRRMVRITAAMGETVGMVVMAVMEGMEATEATEGEGVTRPITYSYIIRSMTVCDSIRTAFNMTSCFG